MEPGLLKSADWPLLIDLYFFLGGLAGGAFVIATVANLLGGERHRDVVRIGYYVAFLAILPGPLFLILDLGLPTRFLHMLMVSKPSVEIGMDAITVGPFHLKPFSPMSVGAWGLLGFSFFAFLAALDVFLEDRGGRSMKRLRVVVGVVGGLFGFFIAAYPGVLLGATARPLFISAHWLGALFLVVGASTGGAAIALILSLFGGRARESLSALRRFTAFALSLQLAALLLFVITVWLAGSAGIARALAQLVAGPYSVTFWLGAVLVGIVVPLVLQMSPRKAAPGMTALVSALILVGGFLVKYVIIAAGQAT
ncbi:MAG TPA: NrfD/PsrC family molybdoenzyme membrane anchor subunit [Methylomirabilota bacterium]|jgi:formate-dependent nitrite reductase membrane component NrfD|nr:NrfD/PsrC family molybdoenzyme membrane anchor subunit [Methylomirabilota bacterium]